MKSVVKAARDGGFDHLAQQLRDEREDTRKVQELADHLTGQGVTVVERPEHGSDTDHVDWLSDKDGNRLDPEQHATCPGHAAYVAQGWEYDDNDVSRRTAEAVYVCTDPRPTATSPPAAAAPPPRGPRPTR